MNQSTTITARQLDSAVAALQQGGVIAYPTEHCFGLGCDPQSIAGLEKLFAMKQRTSAPGLIMIAANTQQVQDYADFSQLSQAQLQTVLDSWPGPNTWILPAKSGIAKWVRGRQAGFALRVSAHPVCHALCEAFAGAIVSTSANRHGQAALLDALSVEREFAGELDYMLDAPVGGAAKPSTIRDALSGKLLR